jgi:pimeloyl-ACP methyl ester carboxylesterase
MNLSESHDVPAVDGARLHIRIRGVKADRPPLLYLHGGPGSGLNLAAFETCAGPYLEPHFPVAYLHQRGVLRSCGPGKTNQSLALHIQDIGTVVAFLHRRFQHPRVHLIGHSWGAFAGCAYLSRYASTVAGFVAVCPVLSFPGVQQELYTLVSEKVGMGGDPTAHLELASIGKPPYPDIDDFIRLQGLAVEAMGDPYRYIAARELSVHTGYDLDTDQCLAVQTQIAASLWPELYSVDLTASLETMATPLLMIACGTDAAVPLTSVLTAFKAYAGSCPGVIKRWLLLENGNHLPFTDPAHRRRCMDEILDFLRTIEK